MKFNGEHVRVNVLMLLMESEIDVTVSAIENLLPQLDDDIIVSVLLNGGHSAYLSQLFESVPNIRYYESGQNLGVAGGRNFLLRTKECIECDVVMILDNDVITPDDYLTNLTTFLFENEDSGVVGGVAADINHAGFPLPKFFVETGQWNNKIFSLTSSDIKRMTMRHFLREKIFHMGAHENYKFTYFSLRSTLCLVGNRLLSTFGLRPFPAGDLKKSRKHMLLLRNGAAKYPVSNVAGCSQTFRRALVDEIGALNDLFNPYGFEDADFCLRAIEAGYRNYIDLNTWLYHGTDDRHKNRASSSNTSARIRKSLRNRTILTKLHTKQLWRFKLRIYSVMLAYVITELTYRRVSGIPGIVKGYRDGLAALQESTTLSTN